MREHKVKSVVVLMLAIVGLGGSAVAEVNEKGLNIVPVREIWKGEDMLSLGELPGGKCIEPIVFRGIAKDWDVVKDMSFEYLREKCGDEEHLEDERVLSRYMKEEAISEEFKEMVREVVEEGPGGSGIKQADFLEHVFENSDITANISVDFSSLENEVSNSSFPMHTGNEGAYTSCFGGTKGNYVEFHTHGAALLVELFGEKLVTMALYSERENLHAWGMMYENSGVDIQNPDLELYPKLLDAKIYQVILYPGDMVYIPENCYHSVHYLKPSAGCARFYPVAWPFDHWRN